ncbi:MAG: PIG-L deacetylase family protein [Microgenomates group bacterium]|jgi:LmbE family N-acetylglucosaminyl deacetylase|nr:PIG-L family deacetylase [Candidatus Woesebacteria bacterium]MBP6882829.1 PIG-L family deacetylase [Candidatus Woesebacteria bacterium]QQR63592.1 MAG: PIG-L family deacetylase [Candidatus Roizmanbacteria bacterium]
MKKVLCIFAHPDDESFGPSGTIHLLTKTHEVYLVCITNGDAGKNSHKTSKLPLAKIRQRELRASSKFLGTKKVFFLNYGDGSLNNLQYHDIAKKIKKISDRLKPETFITFEPRGVSGHLDHIAASMITSYVFERTPYVKKLMHYCLSKDQTSSMGEYFIYRPEGYSADEIDEVVDISTVRELKTASMYLHKSQVHDAQRIIKLFGNFTKEHFIVTERN